MLRIILIRPGETIYDEQERIVGNLDIPLTDAGRESITKLADSLKPLNLEMLYHAPC